MIKPPTLNHRCDRLTDYPFDRLRALLAPLSPPDGVEPLALAIGEPQHVPPALINEVIGADLGLWRRYPPIDGTPDFRAAVADWLTRRFSLNADFIDPDCHVLPVLGSREALFLAAVLAVENAPEGQRPAVAFPNPLYHVYSGAAEMSGADAVPMAATQATGFLPDLNALGPETLNRLSLMYLCSPTNPQGAVASLDYLEHAVSLARRHGFILAMDECYSDIYCDTPPPGVLEACQRLNGGMENVLIFHSLSKRSSAPGLRSGFVAGDPALIKTFRKLRSIGGASMPMPVMAASAALWRDEAHVEENRALYRQKFDLADKLLGQRFDYKRPGGGFFLWLDVSAHDGGEEAAKKLWAEAGLRVLPGAYLSRPAPDGSIPGANYIRVAMVHTPEIVQSALESILRVLR